jgi:hypothetical protein
VSVIGWCGDASVLTFQRPTRRAKSPCVGNIHYRHLPGYRLEVKTVGSGASSRAELRSSALASVNFLFFWDGRPRRPAIRKCSGCSVGKNSDELGRRFCIAGSASAIPMSGPPIRYRCRGYSRTEETSAAALWMSIVRKLEVTSQKGRPPEKRDDYDCREPGLWATLRIVRWLWDRPGSPRQTAAPCTNRGRPEPIKRIRISVNITRA